MEKFLLSLCLLLWGLNTSAQTSFDGVVMKEVMDLVKDKQHNKADSILDRYLSYPQTDDGYFLLYYTKVVNGYNKINTYHDVSVIAPYAEYGKKTFEYLKNNINESNAPNTNYWATLKSYSEIYNYLGDSIIKDIAAFSYHYYKDLHNRDLYALYNVMQNAFQFCFLRNEWDSAISMMHNYYSLGIEEKDSTIRIPLSAGFIGSACFKSKKYKDAEKWFTNSYKRFQYFPERTKFRAYCELLGDFAFFCHIRGKNEQAYNYAMEACEMNKTNFGEYSKEFVNALAILADCEIGLNRRDEGIKHMERVVSLLANVSNMDDEEKQNYRDKLNFLYLRLNIKKSVLAKDSIETENSIILEATNSFVNGDVQDAISKFAYLLNYYNENIKDIDFSNYIYVISSLANAHIAIGEYVEADNVLDQSLSLLRDNHIEHPLIRGIYESKGQLYYTINNVDTALQWYSLAKSMYGEEENQGLQYALLLSNMSICYMVYKDYSTAKQLSDEAYNLVVQFYGENADNANDRLLLLNNLASIYNKMKDFSKSKDLYEEVVNSCVSSQHESTKALALMNLSEIYLLYEQDYKKAEECLLQVQKLDAASYIRDLAEFDLCFVHCITHNNSAIAEIAKYNENIKDRLANMFSYFSETEREAYWTQKSQSLVFLNNLALLSFDNNQVKTMAYDNSLFTKNMLLNSGRLLGVLVKNSADETKEAYSYLQTLKNALSKKGTPKDSIDTYIEKISQLEKQIASSIPNFNERLKKQFKLTSDIQDMLSDDEIAIEFVFLPQLKLPFEDSKLRYGALILTKDSKAPILVPLCSEYDLEDIFDEEKTNNQDFIDKLYDIKDTRLYDLVWSGIEPYISSGKIVYYSPTGYISKINMSAISNGSYRLRDKLVIHEVSTTAAIGGLKERIRNEISNSILFGDINYYEDADMMAENAKTYQYVSSGDVLAARSLTRNTWDLLPSTRDEVKNIRNLLSEFGINTRIISQNSANEESFKAMSGNAPDIIHVASHGFYYKSIEDVTTSFFSSLNSYTHKDFSLLFSGLLFAGANNAWTGKKIAENIEDGILTADEISRLDLEGNKLLVLSACDTGLGAIDKIDGVFGLQRGFKKAGVETILMSLWKVPDKETSILMKSFYEHYSSGESPNKSLKQAQNVLIQMGKSPYFWAGFVVLD